jgi:hypothetical protein
MARVRTLFVALLVLSACRRDCASKSDPPKDQETADLEPRIDIDRYGVMIDQVNDLAEEMESAVEDPKVDTRPLARRLREVVWQLNLSRSQLCARGLDKEVSCGSAYAPPWLTEPDDAAPTMSEILRRSEELGSKVMPYWTFVCDDVRAHTEDEDEKRFVCGIE